ncbi:MAG: hypothetical protein K2F64_07310 [Muribaculaceae bacterium]|nr:hypothetical protein [Muribaculaceae bacterium]
MSVVRFLLIGLLITSFSLGSFAVTKDEMEKARAISAKVYLRWANNGSDYLDAINPSSISELESGLKEKEKENIKAFKNIHLPSDYDSWDKAKLVEFWSGSALSSAGLNADGVRSGARKQIRSKLNALNIAAPSAAPADDAADPAKDEKPETVAQKAEIPEELTVISEETEIEETAVAAEGDSLASPAKKESSSSTWIYIVALVLLVLAVVALVVYASRNMNKSNEGPRGNSPRRGEGNGEERRESQRQSYANMDDDRQPTQYVAATVDNGSSHLREKFAGTLAAKQEEIRQLERQLTSLTEENGNLVMENERLSLEVSRLRNQLDEMMVGGAHHNPVVERKPMAPSVSAGSRQSAPVGGVRNIYLGRVNAQSLFVRADRTFNPGNSIYVLNTTDGFTGTFRVAEHSSVVDLAFSRPQDMLAGGCVAMDITDTRGRSRIVTESPGTAIFEENCWRVIRKAKIRYE